HIHSGTCDDLGDIVAPLHDVTYATGGEFFGSTDAVPIKESDTEVELSLGDILASPHAVNIHESADAIQNYIACGDIGGRVIDDELVIGLQEINGSDHSGVAVLSADDDDETDVTVYLAEEGARAGVEQPAAAPEATEAPAADAEATEEPAAAATAAPADEAPAAQDVPVDIRDFAFSPNPVEIATGDTVTWTNQDEVPHTATAEDRGVLQSGTIAPGASFSQTFAQAGEFPYFCEFHPNMTGTIVVQ
ncbi:MAG: cupredoxin domain-containing protein, partial [Vicinamibacterales bacterium]